MSNVQFTLELDRVGAQGSAARMWLDTSHDDLLQPGEEVALATLDGKVWIGDQDVDGPTTGMPFLVRFIAQIGSRWSFTATAEGNVLYAIKDQTALVTSEFLAARLR